MSERSGDWGARISPDVGLVLAVGSEAKTMLKLIKHTDRVRLSLLYGNPSYCIQKVRIIR